MNNFEVPVSKLSPISPPSPLISVEQPTPRKIPIVQKKQNSFNKSVIKEILEETDKRKWNFCCGSYFNCIYSGK
jgi:hypothetical protein